MRILAVLTDAFGGHGGIAKYNRDLLSAMCSDQQVEEVVALPRLAPGPVEALPGKLRYLTGGLNSKSKFALLAARTMASRGSFDLVVCGHINLLPIAKLAAERWRAPIALCIHGIEAWTRRSSMLRNALAGRVDWVLSVSHLSLERFCRWSNVDESDCRVLPNAVDLSCFAPGPKPAYLVERYRLQGRRVLMTLGRLAASDRYKGFDEVMALMPRLLRDDPALTYLIVGDGDDRDRLERKARGLGIAANVIFTGFISDAEKADYYRVADVFVMPSRGEGFGIVFLEAMASGLPVIGSTLDGGREALRDGMLGTLVDPEEPTQIASAILDCLQKPKRVPQGLEYFSYENFVSRVRRLLPILCLHSETGSLQ